MKQLVNAQMMIIMINHELSLIQNHQDQVIINLIYLFIYDIVIDLIHIVV